MGYEIEASLSGQQSSLYLRRGINMHTTVIQLQKMHILTHFHIWLFQCIWSWEGHEECSHVGPLTRFRWIWLIQQDCPRKLFPSFIALKLGKSWELAWNVTQRQQHDKRKGNI